VDIERRFATFLSWTPKDIVSHTPSYRFQEERRREGEREGEKKERGRGNDSCVGKPQRRYFLLLRREVEMSSNLLASRNGSSAQSIYSWARKRANHLRERERRALEANSWMKNIERRSSLSPP